MKEQILAELNRRYETTIAPNATVTALVAHPCKLSDAVSSAIDECVRQISTVNASRVVDHLNHLSTKRAYDTGTDPDWRAKADAWHDQWRTLGEAMTSTERVITVMVCRILQGGRLWTSRPVFLDNAPPSDMPAPAQFATAYVKTFADIVADSK
jgi:hypothetical protein